MHHATSVSRTNLSRPLLVGIAAAATLLAACTNIAVDETSAELRSDDAWGRRPHVPGPKHEDCPTGSDRCVEKLIRQMNRTFDRLGCSHNAVFSLLYLRTTENIQAAIQAGEFSNRRQFNRVTTAFGTYYLDAFKAWTKGKYSRVPEAWQIAFDMSEDQRVSSLGDIFLGINAHVNRDLAFVYYEHARTTYPDHLHVNDVLLRTQQTVYPEIITRLDLQLATTVPPPGLDLNIFAWRELAWQNAQRLLAAPNQQAFDAIADEIEQHAVDVANDIIAALPSNDAANAFRNAYCEENR